MRAVALLVPIALGCVEPTRATEGPGYDPALFGGDIYHWPLARTIRVYVDDDALVAPTREALAAWQRVLYYREHTFDLTRDPRIADIVLRSVNVPRRVDLVGCEPPPEGSAGVTFICRAGLAPPAQDTALTFPLLANGPGRVKVEITVDPAQAPAGGVLALVAHELGHALGIGTHSDDEDDLMFAAPTVTRPSARDAATLRWLLRVRPDLRL